MTDFVFAPVHYLAADLAAIAAQSVRSSQIDCHHPAAAAIAAGTAGCLWLLDRIYHHFAAAVVAAAGLVSTQKGPLAAVAVMTQISHLFAQAAQAATSIQKGHHLAAPEKLQSSNLLSQRGWVYFDSHSLRRRDYYFVAVDFVGRITSPLMFAQKAKTCPRKIKSCEHWIRVSNSSLCCGQRIGRRGQKAARFSRSLLSFTHMGKFDVLAVVNVKGMLLWILLCRGELVEAFALCY